MLDLCIIYFTACFSALDVDATLHPLWVALNMMKGINLHTYYLFIRETPRFGDSNPGGGGGVF